MTTKNIRLHLISTPTQTWNYLKEFARKYKKAYYGAFLL